MSSDLVTSGPSGPNFAQQGSVDWVSLSGSTLSFSLEVMSRFSKAGVEMITVAMGQALFSNFNVPSAGQKRLSDAVAKLKAFSSYGNVLWFGFGIKHVVRTLCETEQGATCAGICACLSVSYDSFFASRVLKALADDSLAPNNLTPALSQWGALMNVCAGAVTDSTFPNIVEGFSRLLGQSTRTRAPPPLHEPTTPKALAGALLELAKVSNGSLRSITFQGGIDCAWLAAVSQWLLNLRVEIISPSGVCLHSNVLPNSDLYAQVIILQVSPDSHHELEAKALSRSYFVPPGHLCFNLLDEAALGGDLHPQLFSPGRTEWDTILRGAFGWAADELLLPENAHRLATFLCSGLVLSHNYIHGYDSLHNLTPWGFLYSDMAHIIRRFFAFTAHRLPELKHLLHSNVNDIIDGPENISRGFPHVFTDICPCKNCGLGSSTEILCLERVAFTIWRYLWILSWCDIHTSIKPSINGLLMLYYNHAYKDEDAATLRNRLWQRGITPQLVYLFNGLTDRKRGSKAVSALSEGGICVFYHILKDVEVNPFQVARHTIVPGQIERGGSLYRQVSDSSLIRDISNPPAQLYDIFLRYIRSVRWRLVVEETITSDTLEASFDVMNRPLSSEAFKISNYTHLASNLGQQPYSSSTWDCLSIGITAIRSCVLKNIRATPCQNRMVRLSIPASLSCHPSTWTGNCSEALAKSQYCPEQEEWIVERGADCGQCDVIRGSYLLMYSVISHFQVSTRTMLLYVGQCFLDTLDRDCCLRSVTIHIIVDKVPSTVKLVESIDWDPQEEQEATGSPNSPSSSISSSSSGDGDVRGVDLRKRAFYEKQQVKDLEGFLKRRGIGYLEGETKDSLIMSLQDYDICYPDAASEDGFVDEDLEGSDVDMDDVV